MVGVALLLVTASAAPLTTAFAKEPSCVPALSKALGWNVEPLTQGKVISTRQEISPRWVENSAFLRLDFLVMAQKLSPKSRQVCEQQAELVANGLDSFFEKRLDALLAQGAVVSFDREARVVATSPQERMQRLVFDRQTTYMRLILGRLLDSIRQSRWKGYETISINLESWNSEWNLLTGREAPAAVEFETGRVALRPIYYSPDELELFLFHELAHLAMPGRLGGVDGEFYAWTQTLAYVEYRRSAGGYIPELFLNIEHGAKPDLKGWVERVVASRAK